ncbi:MAG: sulfotransferase [Acidiferrobacteraceae bacterium]
MQSNYLNNACLNIAGRVSYWFTPVYEKLPSAIFPQHYRQIQAYCVGMPRSGTVSVADQFKDNFRVGHEPESRFLTWKIIAYKTGKMSATRMQRYLAHRDRRMRLELDSSYLNSEIVELLVQSFPEAKFILTVRDCLSWAESFANFLINKPEFLHRKEHIRRHMALLFGAPPYSYAPYENILKQSGLHPIREYLSYWTAHNQRVLDLVPSDRLLIVKTNEIGDSARRLESFLSVPYGSLSSAVHSNSATALHAIMSQIEPQYLLQCTRECCGDLMARLFPGVIEEYESVYV